MNPQFLSQESEVPIHLLLSLLLCKCEFITEIYHINFLIYIFNSSRKQKVQLHVPVIVIYLSMWLRVHHIMTSDG